MRSIAYSVALLAATSGLLAGCGGGTRACKDGTLFVTVTLDGTTRVADRFSIDVSIDQKTPKNSLRSRTGRGTAETIEVDFPNGYPVGSRVDVMITALENGSPIGMTATGTVAALPAGCGTLTVTLGGAGPGTGGTGGAAGTGAGGTAGLGGTGGAAGRGGTTGVAGRGGGSGGTGNALGRGGAGGTGVVIANRNVDILFLIDDSSSMRLSQDNLNRNFATFVTSLRNSPQGLPNLHLAVISSDMGAGDGSIASCDSSGGRNGIFQFIPRGTCSSSGLNTGATFISDIAPQKNYTGNLETVFSCIAALGEQGCGFEHQFAAITRALGVDGRGSAPAENQTFLRPDALLAIVVLTNEDDCSAAPGNGPNGRIPLYDTSANTNIASQLGPPANFRCNEFGHLCNNGSGSLIHPTRNAPNNNMSAVVTLNGCVSNDTEAFLMPVVDTANKLKGLKADPSMVLVAALTGPATPYTINWRSPPTADTSCGSTANCPWPFIAHSCTATDGSFADPAVRVNQFVGEFGAFGLTQSICSDNFGPALDAIAKMILARLAP